MNFKQAAETVLFGAPEKPKEVKKSTIVILNDIERDYGVRLTTSFRDQLKVLNEDGVVKQKITEFAQEVCSTGFFTTMNKNYTLKLNDKSAKEVIDEWNRENKIDLKAVQMAVEITAFGNTFWQVTSDGFVNIPIDAVLGAKPVSKEVPVRHRYNLELTGSYGIGKLVKYEEFVHGAINVTGKDPLGSGIILGLIACPDEDTPSLYEARKIVRTSITDSFLRFSQTNSLWSFDGATDEQIKALGAKLDDMETGKKSQRIATNVKGSISLEIPERTSSFDKWIEQIDKEFYTALGTGITPDTEYTTKATAEALREYYEMRIAAERRVIKRLLEDVWKIVLDRLGYDGTQAEVKLNFGAGDIELSPTELKDLVALGVITKKEMRRHLIKRARIELDGEEPPLGGEQSAK